MTMTPMMMMMMMMMKVIIMMQILHRQLPLVDKLMTSMDEHGQSFVNFSNHAGCKNFEQT